LIKKFLERYIVFPANYRISLAIFLPVLILVSISLTILYASNPDSFRFGSFFGKQFIWLLISTLFFLIVQSIKPHFFYEYAYILYGFLLIFILLTYFFPSVGGSSRWIHLGGFQFQPSEVGKMIVVFTIAKYLTDLRNMKDVYKSIGLSFLLSGIPALLVFKQPDLGTALVYVFATIPMLIWRGYRFYNLFVVFSPFISIIAASNIIFFSIWIGIVLIILYLAQPKLINGIWVFISNIAFGTITSFIWNNLYQHQKDRILTFLDPMNDPTGSGYQILQSKTAIGSGGLFGVGLGQGTQTHLRFLPVRNSDFIISVIGEEFGLLGIVSIIFCFGVMIYWMVNYSQIIRNQFGSLSIIGFASVLFFHTLVNMGMAVGIFPVTGLPLPFISYGGTFLLSMFLIIGITQNIINNNFK
jgi:rod shape determining protein RodA